MTREKKQELLKSYYDFGGIFVRILEKMKNEKIKDKRRKKSPSEQNLRREMYDNIAKQLNLDSEGREILRKETPKMEKVYGLFKTIGREKLRRVKRTQPSMILKLNFEERRRVIEYFRNK